MDKTPPKNFEKKIQKFWDKNKVYQFTPYKKGKFFCVDTPPPTLSGVMHLGHAFSYTHEDIIVRYHRLRGENILYPFGTDDNGLPTERLVEKRNRVRIFDMERKEFINLCQKTIKTLTPEFIQNWKNIGISCDFDLKYSTISRDVQKISQHFFLELFQKERIYRKEAPILWCPTCQTAIAQAELNDKKLKSSFNNIVFELENGGQITIATTRPELLPSCVAVFVHPNDKRYKKIFGRTAIVPIFGQKVKILKDKKVDPEKGTGIVMCCTFGDIVDMEWFLTYNLDLKISFSKDGKMTELAKRYAGLNIKKAREEIISDLKKKNCLISQKYITHTVNIHERCGTPIEILPVRQWFIKYLDLKNELIESGRKINWHPEYMRKRYENWVRVLKWDWCVSRQRYFGIPIPIWYCAKCGEIILPKKSQLPVDPIYTKPTQKCKCGSQKFIPEKDVLDTWVTSSLTPQIAQSLIKQKNIKGKIFPMSLRPQAHDIISTWLFYTMVRSKIYFNEIPWKNILISGFALDSKGKKMSKSKGNVILPQAVIDKFGVDALRYWTAGINLGEDLRYNEEELRIGKRTITKLWNASRFFSMHAEHKKNIGSKAIIKELEEADWWILTNLYEAIKKYCACFDKYNYFQARKIVDELFWQNFSDNYLEAIKYRLYNSSSKKSHRAALFTLNYCLLNILKLYSPFIPFITEQIYQSLFRKKEKMVSIHQSILKEEKSLRKHKTKEEFEHIIKLLAALRKYKSERKTSLKMEIPKLLIQAEGIKIEKYFELLQKTMSIKKILLKPSQQKITDKISITIIDKKEN